MPKSPEIDNVPPESGWPPRGITAYAPRAFGSLGTWREGPWALKAYGIHHRRPAGDRTLIDPIVADAARAQVRVLLPQADEEGDHYQTFRRPAPGPARQLAAVSLVGA